MRETCRIGVCGACTVLVDDEPVSGCLLLTAQAAGRRVTTVDGLPAGDPTVRAFADQHAFQCGYCTPGFVLTARALLDERPQPDEHEIAEALGGNLCRCGSYRKIVAAVRQAAGDRPPTRGESTMKLENAFTVPAPIDRAWEVLLDVERIAPCVPGATLKGRDGDAYTGEMKLKLGPMLNTFQGSLEQQEADAAARRSVMKASARADRGQGNAAATITSVLTPEGDGTRVERGDRAQRDRPAGAVRPRRDAGRQREADGPVRRLPGRGAGGRGARRGAQPRCSTWAPSGARRCSSARFRWSACWWCWRWCGGGCGEADSVRIDNR